MSGMEGLGRLFNAIPVADTKAFSMRDCSAVALLVTSSGAASIAVTASSSFAGSYVAFTPANGFGQTNHWYQATATDGTATEMVKITVVRNPTAGTIVDNATAVDINSNRNYGSSLTLSDSLAYKGATSETMTDGDDHILIQAALSSRVFATIDEVIPKGKSLGIKIDPPAGNTSMVVYAALICHLEDASA